MLWQWQDSYPCNQGHQPSALTKWAVHPPHSVSIIAVIYLVVYDVTLWARFILDVTYYMRYGVHPEPMDELSRRQIPDWNLIRTTRNHIKGTLLSLYGNQVRAPPRYSYKHAQTYTNTNTHIHTLTHTHYQTQWPNHRARALRARDWKVGSRSSQTNDL